MDGLAKELYSELDERFTALVIRGETRWIRQLQELKEH